jgi:hypothetical protein
LAIRFVYREGPVVAVRGVRLTPASLSAGLSILFAVAHGAQMAAEACVAASDAECGLLRKRCDTLQQQLDALPLQLQEAQEQQLAEMLLVLNAQKRRCFKIWQATKAEAGLGGKGAAGPSRPGAGLPADEQATASLEQCLDRGEEENAMNQANPEQEEQMDDEYDGFDDQMSLAFATMPPQSQMPASGGTMGVVAAPDHHASASIFTIPLTLGMGGDSCAPPATVASARCSLPRGPVNPAPAQAVASAVAVAAGPRRVKPVGVKRERDACELEDIFGSSSSGIAVDARRAVRPKIEPS